MLYIQDLFQNISTAHENIRARFSPKAKIGIIATLAVMVFIILIFKAEFLMAHMIALLPVFYVSAVLAVGFKRALYGTAVFIFCCFTLWLRVGPPHQGVLGGSYVLFAENDGWYNMRLIENLVHHFPIRNSFEPYTLYPSGQIVPFAPFFDWSAALIIWIAGLGHPSEALIEKIGAYYPAVLGTLTVIPVYFIGKELFNRNAGLLAAGLLAILPGEFLFRSILGFTDHHAAEALFSTTTMAFLILAIKRAQEAQPTLSQIKRREWGTIKKPLLFAILAGFSLGIYILSWIGAALFIFIILAYLVIQYILDHLNGRSTDYLAIVSVPVLIASLVIAAPFYKFLLYGNFVFGGLVIGLLGISVLQIISYVMNRRNIRRIFYPLSIVVLGLIGLGFLDLIYPSLFHSIIDRFRTLLPSFQSVTIMEAQPLLSGLDISHLINHRIWGYFTTGLIMVPAAFFLITYSAIGKGKRGKMSFLGWIVILILTVIIDQITAMPWQIYLVEGLAILALYVYFEKSSAKIILLIWSFVSLLALLSQTRYAYYYAINVALLSSYILWKMPKWISLMLQFTSKTWKWLLAWICIISVTLIIDKKTFLSVPAALYAIEGITTVSWLACKALASGVKRQPVVDKRESKAAKQRRENHKKEQTAFRYLKYLKLEYVSVILSIIVIFSLTVYPNFIYGGTYNQNTYADQPCYQVADTDACPSCSASLYLPNHPYGPNGDWYEALTWMKNNTPDPFGNPDFYYELYDAPKAGETYQYPDSAYGVMSWWDYGHWITRIAHRIPNANPFQAGIGGTGAAGNPSENPGASTFMTAQDEATASAFMDALDSRYVVIDYETAWPKYHTMVTWSGKNLSDFYEYWYRDAASGELRMYEHPDPKATPEVQLFYPAYYQSICARLYNFGTKAVVPDNSSWVISYTWQTAENGERYKVMTDVANDQKPFATYEEALSFINDHPGYVVVGTNPFVSPIPLEALKEYTVIHSSPTILIQTDTINVSYVEVFEYTGYKK